MTTLTPMMAQYKEIKAKHQDCILMFRLGDFYEMFFEDALVASKILQIALTSRNKGKDGKVPMCGVPFHAVDNYLAKLTRAGKKVAICDQMEVADGKTLVRRDVIRIVTPGTTFDENIIDQKANNFVACVVEGGGSGRDGQGTRSGQDGCYALAYSDITTGEFRVTEFGGFKDLATELGRLAPAECICEEMLIAKMSGNMASDNMAKFPYEYFGEAETELKKHFEVHSLRIFGLEGKTLAIQAAGMLFAYLKETQKTDLKHIQKISYYEVSEFMPLDEACIRNLEIFYTAMDGKKDGSLIGVLDQTMCPMGGRLLKSWLIHPLVNKPAIEERFDKIDIFIKNSSLMRNVRDVLKGVFDIERLLGRLSLGTGNARNLVAMKKSLEIIPALKSLLGNTPFADSLIPLPELHLLLDSAINEEAPLSIRDGGMIKPGFNSELDSLRGLSTEGKTFIKNLQEREITRTGISSLKVRFNKVFGYYIEISKANLASAPSDYMRKQTLVNAERFITPELKEYEEKVLTAEDRIKELEYELFYQVRMEVVKEIAQIQKIAKAIGEIDVVSNLAFIAEKNRYCRPVLSESGKMKITNGRHPVLEQINFARDFVPNDCEFNENRKFLLITGPNMGGKSTYLRQVALTVLMTQIGSFVPAEKAFLPIVDRIFTRVGATDNLVRGESTFMVEMQEASYILNNATEKSLIILDEIGRGTSTYDGVSIAWAIMEFIHDKIQAKTLFATHYHELIELAEKLDNAVNLSVAIRENEKEDVVFLYKIVEGGIDKSYGIEVAKLAGLPINVISRARGVLAELETKHIQKSKVHKDQIELFEEERIAVGLKKESEFMKDIKSLDIDKMTPLEAMQKLHEMKKKSDL